MLFTEQVECPYCGEAIELSVDASVEAQHYVEDCSVCCRPIEVEITVDEGAGTRVICRTDNDA
jgi:hypothetical protein